MLYILRSHQQDVSAPSDQRESSLLRVVQKGTVNAILKNDIHCHDSGILRCIHACVCTVEADTVLVACAGVGLGL